MSWKKWVLITMTAGVMGSTMGCESIKEHETAQGALIGTGIGAAGGALVGQAAGHHAAEGALIGGAAGAAAGTGIGYGIEQKRKAREGEYDHHYRD